MRSGTVCVVGSLNADKYLGLARLPEPGETVLGESLGLYAGGKGMNQAVAAARCGAVVRMCGALGNDTEGKFLRRAMMQAGIDASAVATVDAQTGMAYILSQAGGENSIVVLQGANALVAPESATAAAQNAAVVLVQLEIDPVVAAQTLATARRNGALTVLNAAPAHPAALSMLSDVDVLIVNESEAKALGGVEGLSALTTVVHTRGAAGLSVHPLEGNPFEEPGFLTTTVDTTGAGDAFCGGLIAALARGHSLDSAARAGAAAGAIVAGHRGAQAPALTLDALTKMVQTVEGSSPEN